MAEPLPDRLLRIFRITAFSQGLALLTSHCDPPDMAGVASSGQLRRAGHIASRQGTSDQQLGHNGPNAIYKTTTKVTLRLVGAGRFG
jgi:hypothetical protein